MNTNPTNTTDIEVVDATPVAPLQTEIATVHVSRNIVETSAFQKVLDEIPKQVAHANQLLSDYRSNKSQFLATVDETALSDQMAQLKEVASFIRSIEKSKKEIKKYLKDWTDGILGQLDNRLAESKFDELAQAESDMKQLKKDIETDRREERWNEIKAQFLANIERYPLISQHGQKLADFTTFKLMYPTLVSGAKTRVLKESDFTTVNETVYGWNAGLVRIIENEWDLDRHDANHLLARFIQEPLQSVIETEAPRLKQNAIVREQQAREAEARRIEAERQAEIARQEQAKRLAELQAQEAKARQERDALAAENARLAQERLEQENRARLAEQERLRQAELERQAQFSLNSTQYPIKMRESYPRFMQYLFSNPAYQDIHTNPATKATVIHDVMHQVDRADSVVSMETNRDPQQVLDLVRFLLDA